MDAIRNRVRLVWLVVLQLAGASVAVCAGAPEGAAAPTDFFAVQELAEGVFLFHPQGPGPLRANSLVIEREGDVLVVDAQPTPEAARLLLERIPRHAKGPVRFLVLSHPHSEAAGGATAFSADTVVVASAAYRDAIADPSFDFGAEARLLLGDAWDEPERARVDLVLTGPTELDDPRQPVRLMPIEAAHAPGDLFVDVPRADLLYAGGLVFHDGNPYASTANVGTWIAVLTHLIDNGPLRIAGVRGPVVRADDLRRQRDALAWVQGHVEQGFVDRLPLEAIEQRVLGEQGIEQRFDTRATPSFLPLLVRQVVVEGAEHRRKRGRPIAGEGERPPGAGPG